MTVAIITDSSDSGGIGAKKGFIFQDHVAVRHLLDLLSDSTVLEVHCETRDDITILQEFYGQKKIKHVQVKTTEKQKLWSTEELCEEEIVPKQLKLDDLEIDSEFSVVSTRALGSSSIKVLSYPLGRRDLKKRSQLINLINKKNKNPTSPNNNGAQYWVDNCVWEVIKELDALQHRNTNKINNIAVSLGYNLTTSQIEIVYNKLLVLVMNASAASKKTDPSKKIFPKENFEITFRDYMDIVARSGNPTKHPYVGTEGISPFLVTIFEKKIDGIKTGHGLDIGMESNVFRAEDFVEYIKLWLPEFSLQASEISNLPTNHLAFMSKLQDSARKIRDKFEGEMDEILGNLTLHACLRVSCESEPIPCKVFYLSDNQKYKPFRISHIVGKKENQQLWLGSSVVTKKSFTDSIPDCFKLIESVLDPAFLKQERRVIFDLFEPSHYSYSEIQGALDKNVPIDELSKILCVSVLVIYQSDKFSDRANYQKKLKEEMESNFEALVSRLPSEMSSINIYIFMLPAESVSLISDEFNNRLGG